MPLTLESTDYIPAIDAALDAEQLSSIRSRVQAYLPADYKTRRHPAIDTTYTPSFAPSLLAEGARISAQRPRDAGSGIDLSRYEAEALEAADARAALAAAYSTASHLGGRAANLALLEAYGRNAWLVGNAALEDVLRGLERDVEARRMELERWGEARRAGGAAARVQLEGLEREWRRAVGGSVDVKVAVEELRVGVLEAKRAGGKV